MSRVLPIQIHPQETGWFCLAAAQSQKQDRLGGVAVGSGVSVGGAVGVMVGVSVGGWVGSGDGVFVGGCGVSVGGTSVACSGSASTIGSGSDMVACEQAINKMDRSKMYFLIANAFLCKYIYGATAVSK